MARSASGWSHSPLKAAFTGSNPVRAAIEYLPLYPEWTKGFCFGAGGCWYCSSHSWFCFHWITVTDWTDLESTNAWLLLFIRRFWKQPRIDLSSDRIKQVIRSNKWGAFRYVFSHDQWLECVADLKQNILDIVLQKEKSRSSGSCNLFLNGNLQGTRLLMSETVYRTACLFLQCQHAHRLSV